VRVPPVPSVGRRLVFVRLEELVVQRERAVEDHQTTVIGAILVLRYSAIIPLPAIGVGN